ncbi:MAG: START-like domain-containing protein [Rikenellaceae bacterium]
MKKQKFQFEYIFNTTPQSIFSFISTPNGLSQWFADSVNELISDPKSYEIWWGKTPSKIIEIASKSNKYIRFCWEEDKDSNYYFELSIHHDELTMVNSLIITDFTEEDDFEDLKSFWDSNIKRLKCRIGSK